MNEVRNIKVVSSRGKRAVELETSVGHWGELQSLLIAAGVELNNLKGIENVNKTTLEKSSAILPTGPFTLFLAPIKTSSGANTSLLNLSFRDLRKVLLEHDLKMGVEAMFCSEDGRNWTQLKKDELITGLETLLPMDLMTSPPERLAKSKVKAPIIVNEPVVEELLKKIIILLEDMLGVGAVKPSPANEVEEVKETEEVEEVKETEEVEEARLSREFDAM